MATKKITKVIPPTQEPEETESGGTLPFHRLRYNVEKKRGQIATHQAELIPMERELQLRCDHYDVERFQQEQPGDFYNKTILVNMIRCNTCGLTRPIS